MKHGEMLAQAISIAANAHVGQTDKGGQPYILHPLKVMHYLKTFDEELMCIAVLHDVIEDTPVTYDELYEAGMTERVVEGVRALTKLQGYGYDNYRAQVMQNYDAMLVKMADLRHNMDIRRLKSKVATDKDIQRMVRYHNFYSELKDAVARARKSGEIED